MPAIPPAPSDQDSVGTLIARLGVDVARIVRAEAGLLGMRLVAAVDVLKTVATSAVAGVVCVTTGFGITMLGLVFLLSRWVPNWAAGFIVGGALLVLGGAVAAVAIRNGARDVSAALTTNPIETHPL